MILWAKQPFLFVLALQRKEEPRDEEVRVFPELLSIETVKKNVILWFCRGASCCQEEVVWHASTPFLKTSLFNIWCPGKIWIFLSTIFLL